MKKQVLNEVNRTREIMGLGKLITERQISFTVGESGELDGNYGYIEDKLYKRYKVRNMAALEGYSELNTLLGRGLPGYPIIDIEAIITAFVMNLGGGKITKSGLKAFMGEMQAGGFDVEVGSVKVPEVDGEVFTQGNVIGKDIDIDKRNNKEPFGRLIKYLNGYNIQAYAHDASQYDVSMLVKDGSLDLTSGPSGEDGALLLYATTTGMLQGVEQKEKSTEQIEKGYEATGRYQTDYATGDSTPQPDVVEKAVMEIQQMFPADIAGNLNVFNLESGASANWGPNEIFDPSEGKGDTGYAEGNEGKNQKLAFDRGDRFMQEVNKGLKAEGHPGFDNYVVNWKVEGQGKANQFIDLMLNYDKEDKIKTTTIVTGEITGEKEAQRASGNLTTLTILTGVA